jgi:hypothetical protein
MWIIISALGLCLNMDNYFMVKLNHLSDAVFEDKDALTWQLVGMNKSGGMEKLGKPVNEENALKIFQSVKNGLQQAREYNPLASVGHTVTPTDAAAEGLTPGDSRRVFTKHDAPPSSVGDKGSAGPPPWYKDVNGVPLGKGVFVSRTTNHDVIFEITDLTQTGALLTVEARDVADNSVTLSISDVVVMEQQTFKPYPETWRDADGNILYIKSRVFIDGLPKRTYTVVDADDDHIFVMNNRAQNTSVMRTQVHVCKSTDGEAKKEAESPESPTRPTDDEIIDASFLIRDMRHKRRERTNTVVPLMTDDEVLSRAEEIAAKRLARFIENGAEQVIGPKMAPSFEKDLEDLLNRHGKDSDCSMPDHILASVVSRFVDDIESGSKKLKASGDVEEFSTAATDEADSPKEAAYHHADRLMGVGRMIGLLARVSQRLEQEAFEALGDCLVRHESGSGSDGEYYQLYLAIDEMDIATDLEGLL